MLIENIIQIIDREGESDEQLAALEQAITEEGVDVNATDNLGDSYLSKALNRNKLRMAALFIQHGADVNGGNSKTGLTYLGKACYVGKVEAVKLLINHGADVNKVVEGWNRWNRTAFLDALQSNDHYSQKSIEVKAEIIKLLVEQGVSVPERYPLKNNELIDQALEVGKAAFAIKLANENSLLSQGKDVILESFRLVTSQYLPQNLIDMSGEYVQSKIHALIGEKFEVDASKPEEQRDPNLNVTAMFRRRCMEALNEERENQENETKPSPISIPRGYASLSSQTESRSRGNSQG